MPEPVRWGILGVAQIAIDQMAPAIHAAPGGMLAAIATSSHPDKAAPLAAMAPGLKVVEGYDALLDDPGIDAVYVPLPNHLHVDWAIRAARAGKHVLCEKPAALDLAGIDALIAARDAAGVLIAEAWMIAHHPQWDCAREAISSGALGGLHRIDAVFTAPLTDPDDFRNQRGGGGALRDLGPYVLGAARLLTGEEPEAILHAHIDHDGGVDASVEVTARFPSCLFSGHMSMRAELWQHLSVQGRAGTLRLPVPFNPLGLGEARVELHRETDARIWRFPEENQYVRQVAAFNDALRGGADFPLPLERVRGTQAMVDAVYAAAGSPPT
jgi:predicted dehydrogenase